MTQLKRCEHCLAWPACQKSRRCLVDPFGRGSTEPRPASCVGSGAAGSMLFIVRVLDRERARMSRDDKVFAASEKITARYMELRTKMCFTEASEQARTEWLTEYLSSNTEMRSAADVVERVWDGIFACDHSITKEGITLRHAGHGKNASQELRRRLKVALSPSNRGEPPASCTPSQRAVSWCDRRIDAFATRPASEIETKCDALCRLIVTVSATLCACMILILWATQYFSLSTPS